MSTVAQSAPGQAPATADLEGCDPELFAQRMGVMAEWQRIKALTAELFSGPIKLQVVRDPELAGEAYIWMRVVCSASVEEIVQREMDWINAGIDAAGEHAGLFRISVDITR